MPSFPPLAGFAVAFSRASERASDSFVGGKGQPGRHGEEETDDDDTTSGGRAASAGLRTSDRAAGCQWGLRPNGQIFSAPLHTFVVRKQPMLFVVVVVVVAVSIQPGKPPIHSFIRPLIHSFLHSSTNEATNPKEACIDFGDLWSSWSAGPSPPREGMPTD